MTVDARVLPLVEIDRETIQSAFEPITHEALGTITRVDGGLVNTLYRVTTLDQTTYALRVSALDTGSVRSVQLGREADLLTYLAAFLPVPRPVLVDTSGRICGHPFAIYPWVDGITLNQCRKEHGRTALLSLSTLIGRLVASIASVRRVDSAFGLPALSVTNAIRVADDRLTGSRVRERLGAQVADTLRAKLRESATTLEALDRERGLVHADLGGRNIIVRETPGGGWEVAGLLDWEMAAIGSPLWDVGSLFRYSTRYSAEFRAAFERGYREGGGALPDEWGRLSRLLDVTVVVGTLSSDRDLPTVFDDCRSIVASLI